MHETVGSYSCPGLTEPHGGGRRFFLDAGGPNLFGLVCGPGDDGRTEEQEHERNPCGKDNKRGCDPE